MMFESSKQMPFCLEKFSVRKRIFFKMFKVRILVGVELKSGKICQNNDHTCFFIAVTLAGYLS